MRLKILDWLALVLCAGVVAAASVAVYAKGGGELRVVVSGEAGEWIYPLGEDRVVSVGGTLGDTVVEIHDGAVHFASSPCPNQTCVAAGGVSQPGQWLACLPNAVFVRVEGSSPDDSIDAGAY